MRQLPNYRNRVSRVNGDKFTHGEYVLKGMLTECAMFKDLIDPEYYARIIERFQKRIRNNRSERRFKRAYKIFYSAMIYSRLAAYTRIHH